MNVASETSRTPHNSTLMNLSTISLVSMVEIVAESSIRDRQLVLTTITERGEDITSELLFNFHVNEQFDGSHGNHNYTGITQSVCEGEIQCFNLCGVLTDNVFRTRILFEDLLADKIGLTFTNNKKERRYLRALVVLGKLVKKSDNQRVQYLPAIDHLYLDSRNKLTISEVYRRNPDCDPTYVQKPTHEHLQTPPNVTQESNKSYYLFAYFVILSLVLTSLLLVPSGYLYILKKKAEARTPEENQR